MVSALHDDLPAARYTQAGGVSIAYQVIGEGPAVVLVPGLLNTIEAIWHDPDMAASYRQIGAFAQLILFDKRGTGMSDRLPSGQEVRLDERMDDIRAVMDAAGCEHAVLIAQSDGVPVATMFAAAFPHRVSGLIVYAASARMLPDEGYDVGGLSSRAWDRALAGFEARWGDPDDPAAIETITPSRKDDPEWRAVLARMQRVTLSPRAAREYWRMSIELDIRDVLPAVRVPTLVLHRAGDRLHPPAQGRWFADHVDGARYVEIPGGDHFSIDGCIDEIEEFLTGRRGSSAPDSSLVTILFTDIVASTQTAAALGDRSWGALLDRHDAMVRRELERYRGREIKHTGDGFLATFDGPARAIEAAQAMRDGSRAQELEIRAGLHTGVVKLRGADIAGAAVNIAARVQACAQPSEVLVSRTLADLLTGSSFTFSDRGLHELKGIDERWQLYAVT